MAISMSDGAVDSTERTSLLGQTVDLSLTSGTDQGAGTSFSPDELGSFEGGAKLAGITATFASDVTSKIEAYISTVKGYLGSMMNVANSAAFKGTDVSKNLKMFVGSVAIIGSDYAERLKAAENQIINSVATIYQTQDENLGTSLQSDGNVIVGNNIDFNRYPDGIVLNTKNPDDIGNSGASGPTGAH